MLGSLSKTYAMTGWRLGYALAPAAVTSAMAKLQSQSTSNPTSIVQKAAVAALKGPQECVEQMRREYIQLRDHVVQGLRSIPGVTCTLPEGAFYAYPNISAFLGRGGLKSASDVAGDCCAKRMWPRFRARDSAHASTFGFRMLLRKLNWIAGWSACGSSSARCSNVFTTADTAAHRRKAWIRFGKGRSV